MSKILVIEDNTEVRENLVEILELSNYEVVSAENGKIGIEKAIEHVPDIILCDVMMPVLDGYGVMKILSKNPKINHIPLIYLTAKAEKADFRKGMSLGAEDYITKPFDDVELIEAIETRLKKAERIQNTFDDTDEGLQRFFSEAKANEEFEKLSTDKEIRSFKSKDVIYEEGDAPRYLYFIITGKVKLFQTNDYGKELTTELLSPGDFFGYFSLLHGNNYINSATCLSDCSLRLIPKEDFSLLLYNNRDFAAQFIKMLSNKTHDKEKKLIEMAYSSVRKKVANALVEYVDSDNSELQIKSINTSREELAALAGTAKETLIRTLSDFKSEGLIGIENKNILVLKYDELKNMIQ